jgi:AAA family ATP:ADP antiporter
MMLYEIVVTIFDYQMQILADGRYSAASYASFNAFYGQLVTLVACLFAFLGTRFFINRFGFRFCLVLFPSIIALLVGYFYFNPSLWVALSCMVAIKALSYGFNNPIKEIIYIPTSNDIKFKAKGWIEMFGNRSSKAGGATINGALGSISNGFMNYAAIISLAAIGAWIVVAVLMGQTFSRLVKSRKIVR